MTDEARRAAARAASARYRAAHPERRRATLRESAARRRADRPEQEREYATAYRARNAARYAAHASNRRARERGAVGEFTDAQWANLLEEFDHRCAYCQASDQPLTREHMLPLSRGGAHALHNIVPACGSCNSRKGTLTAFEFLARGLPHPSLKETSK